MGDTTSKASAAALTSIQLALLNSDLRASEALVQPSLVVRPKEDSSVGAIWVGHPGLVRFSLVETKSFDVAAHAPAYVPKLQVVHAVDARRQARSAVTAGSGSTNAQTHPVEGLGARILRIGAWVIALCCRLAGRIGSDVYVGAIGLGASRQRQYHEQERCHQA